MRRVELVWWRRLASIILLDKLVVRSGENEILVLWHLGFSLPWKFPGFLVAASHHRSIVSTGNERRWSQRHGFLDARSTAGLFGHIVEVGEVNGRRAATDRVI